jgi:hypothetical protein
MPILSDISHVDYFQCETCHVVSLMPKDGGSPAVLELMPAARAVAAARSPRS